MLAKIEELLKQADELKASTAEELEALRIKYLSKKGAINALMADFRNVPAEQKKEVGMKLNELKNKIQERISALKESFDSQDNGAAELDLTRTAYPVKLGTRHPLSIVRNEIINIFSRMGFTIADGPEVEDDWHVFSSMNFPEDHPARDMQDTFSSKVIQTFCCVHIHRLYRAVLWRLANRLSALSVRDVFTVTKLSATVHTASSIR